MAFIVHKNKDGSYRVTNTQTGKVYETFTPCEIMNVSGRRSEPKKRRSGRRASSRTPRRPAISVAQFNVLAGNLGTTQHFPYVQARWLNWAERRERLVSAMVALKADIICCQELNDFWTFFRPVMAQFGYDGVYVQRPSSSSNKGGWSGQFKLDGCAIFYRTDRLRLEQAYSFVYADEFDRVALFVRLQHRGSGREFVVATTHLYWDSTRPDVQIAELQEFDAVLSAITDESTPVFVAGDFNNGPQSVPVTYVRNEMQLASAYGGPNGETEPPFTSFNYRRKWTIDYIFYNPALSRVVKLATPFTLADMTADPGPADWDPEVRGIPNSRVPSDHIPLCATFIL